MVEKMDVCPYFTVRVRRYLRQTKMQVIAREMQCCQLQMWEMFFTESSSSSVQVTVRV